MQSVKAGIFSLVLRFEVSFLFPLFSLRKKGHALSITAISCNWAWKVCSVAHHNHKKMSNRTISLCLSKCIRCYSTEKTFSNQSKLPRLPIPDLEATATRYKRSLLPLLSQSEYDEACAKVDRFVKGQLGRALQDRLHRLDEQEAKRGLSWLDQIWLNKAYLEYRAPTLINVNWWNQFRDPPQGLESMPTPPPGAASDFQLNRAAKMIVGIVEYSNKVNRSVGKS